MLRFASKHNKLPEFLEFLHGPVLLHGKPLGKIIFNLDDAKISFVLDGKRVSFYPWLPTKTRTGWKCVEFLFTRGTE